MTLDTMRLDTKPGEKVRFLNQNGYDYERTIAAELLDTETEYEVEFVDVGDFRSSVKLKGFRIFFNTVMFENIEPAQEAA